MPDLLIFRPLQGSFDVAQVNDYLSRLGYSVRDPIRSELTIVASTAETRDYAIKLRTAVPPGNLPYLLLVSVAPDEVTVDQMTKQAELELANQFTTWLSQHYACSVRDDYDHDLTETYGGGRPEDRRDD